MRLVGECRECVMMLSITDWRPPTTSSVTYQTWCLRIKIKHCLKTHRSRSRVWDLFLIGGPVMLRSFPVGKRTIKGSSDIFHVIDTYCIAFKHRTAKKRFMVTWCLEKNKNKTQLHKDIPMWPSPSLPRCAKETKDFWIFSILVFEHKHVLWNTKSRI